MSSVGQLLVGITQAVQQPNEAIAKRSREAEQELCILTQLLKNFSAAQNPHSSWTRRHLQTAGQAMQLLGSALHNIQGDVEHIRSLAHVLKGLSQDRHELAAVNVNFLLDDTLRLLEHRLAGQQQHLSIQVLRQYGDIPMIECNITQLNQVFVHLFNNAIEAIEMRFYQGAQIEHPSIRIRTQLLHSGHVLIRITDNGCGIPEGNQSKIFTPFFTTKSQNQGIGLGLFACQNIIQQHQGRIRCISIPNRGTDFLLELPLKQIRQKQQLDQKPLLNLAQNSHQSLPVVISHNRSNQLDPIGATQALQHNNYPIKPTKHNPMDWI